ncbi:hypothetical protein Trco_005997 [Trichoderma cornu-damae]|uniref:Uncharacterized protein n=1 Tax=Trichoderma cornu-damae TaxID=654480 RepID=A0A9P8TVR7_9HYPO|nr:hypothetical protein Trco_005997 [Trichoderma cornu-damae]
MLRYKQSGSFSKGVAQTQQRHAQEGKEHAQVTVVIEAEALDKELQPDADHDARGQREEARIRDCVGGHVRPVGELEPQSRDGGPERLRQPAEQGRPGHGPPAGPEGHVQRQGHGEAFGDVVDEERHEDVESQGRVGVVRRIGDEALGELVQGYGNGRLQPYGEEGVGGDVVVMLRFNVSLVHLRTGIAVVAGRLVRQGQGVAGRHPAGADGCVVGARMGVVVGGVKGVMGVEVSGGRAQERWLARIAGRAAAEVLEALLAARIGVSVTGPRLVAVALCVLDKGHDPLLDVVYGRAPAERRGVAPSGGGPAAGMRPRAAGPLHHLVPRRSAVSRRRAGNTGLRAEQRGGLAGEGLLVMVILGNVGDFGIGVSRGSPPGEARSRMRSVGMGMVGGVARVRRGVVVAMIAVDDVRGHELVDDSRDDLDADEAPGKEAHHDEPSSLSEEKSWGGGGQREGFQHGTDAS